MPYDITRPPWVNLMALKQNGRLVADDIFNCIFFNENLQICIQISMEFVPMGPIDYKSVLV